MAVPQNGRDLVYIKLLNYQQGIKIRKCNKIYEYKYYIFTF